MGMAIKMADRGHSVLVVSDRVQFLEELAKRTTKHNPVCITGGSANLEEREILTGQILSGESKILYGTRSIFSEGVSINRLSCLILASPIANTINLTQVIGRIQRTYPEKKTPIVIDIKFLDNTGQRQLKTRMEHYISKGYKIFLLEKFVP
jgi:superfamily II DNA or RNA helicase